MKNNINFLILLLMISVDVTAKLNVVTTVSDLAAITEEVGKDYVTVSSIAKGTQDPHFIEAKPSFMTKLNRADLVIAIGLDLEIGWLPQLLQGARNPKILKGQTGYLEVGPKSEPLEIATGSISRSDGDVHPDGNPHVMLDPIRAAKIALMISAKLSELDSEHKLVFEKNAKNLSQRLELKTQDWQKRIAQTKKIVTYHKTLTYFFDRFHLENPAILEPKPGIPPTSGHIMTIIDLIKKEKIPLILVENFFDPTVTNKIINNIPTLRAATVAVSVGGAEAINSIDDLYENLVKVIEGK